MISEEEAENIVPQVEVKGPAKELILFPDSVGLAADSLSVEELMRLEKGLDESGKELE